MDDRVREVDANLLPVLHALLEERNLTRAGARVSLSQPAVSGALTRLRGHFGDELLVRTGRGFELTPLAVELQRPVGRAVEAADSLLGGQVFVPSVSRRRFSVSMSEYAMTVVAEPLARAVHAMAPGCSMVFDTIETDPDEPQLLRRDLMVGPVGFGLPGRRQPLFTDRLVCIVDRANPRLRDGALNLADLREMPHAVAEFTARGPHERPLEPLARQAGLGDRHVAVTVTSLLTLPYVVAGTGLVGFVPSRLARRCEPVLGVRVARTPLPVIEIVVAAHWHDRRTDDPAVQWLRHVLHDVSVELEDGVPDDVPDDLPDGVPADLLGDMDARPGVSRR